MSNPLFKPKAGNILNPMITTDASGYGQWVKTSAGPKCLKVEGTVPVGYTFTVVWRYYGSAPMPAYIDYTAGTLLVLNKVGKVVLFESNEEIQYNVLVKNAGVPLANTAIAGLNVGV